MRKKVFGETKHTDSIHLMLFIFSQITQALQKPVAMPYFPSAAAASASFAKVTFFTGRMR